MRELVRQSCHRGGPGAVTFDDAGTVWVGELQDDSSSTETEESKEDFFLLLELFPEIRETDSLGSET